MTCAARDGNSHAVPALSIPGRVPGRVSVALPAIVAGDTTIRDVLIDARPDGVAWRIDRVRARLPGRTRFEAKGQLGVGSDFTFSGEMVLASKQPSGLASWLTTDVEDRTPRSAPPPWRSPTSHPVE